MLAQSVVCQSTMKADVLCVRTVATLSVGKGNMLDINLFRFIEPYMKVATSHQIYL